MNGIASETSFLAMTSEPCGIVSETSFLAMTSEPRGIASELKFLARTSIIEPSLRASVTSAAIPCMRTLQILKNAFFNLNGIFRLGERKRNERHVCRGANFRHFAVALGAVGTVVRRVVKFNEQKRLVTHGVGYHKINNSEKLVAESRGAFFYYRHERNLNAHRVSVAEHCAQSM